MNLKSIEVIAGPTEIAYQYREDESLKVWIGEQVENAPPTANRTAILDGYTTWEIREVEDDATTAA